MKRSASMVDTHAQPHPRHRGLAEGHWLISLLGRALAPGLCRPSRSDFQSPFGDAAAPFPACAASLSHCQDSTNHWATPTNGRETPTDHRERPTDHRETPFSRRQTPINGWKTRFFPRNGLGKRFLTNNRHFPPPWPRSGQAGPGSAGMSPYRGGTDSAPSPPSAATKGTRWNASLPAGLLPQFSICNSQFPILNSPPAR